MWKQLLSRRSLIANLGTNSCAVDDQEDQVLLTSEQRIGCWDDLVQPGTMDKAFGVEGVAPVGAGRSGLLPLSVFGDMVDAIHTVYSSTRNWLTPAGVPIQSV